jgi:hypothetical protein
VLNRVELASKHNLKLVERIAVIERIRRELRELITSGGLDIGNHEGR